MYPGDHVPILCAITYDATFSSEQIRSPFYSQDQYQLAHSMFDKITADLYQAQTDAGPLEGSSRFVGANNQIRQLKQSWDKGQYLSREMETTISAIQTVLTDNRLMPRDRDALSADLSQLLDFRAEYY